VKACWRICFKISGFNGNEKKRAKEIIEAESLSAGKPAAEIKEETERATACCEAGCVVFKAALAACVTPRAPAPCAAFAFERVFCTPCATAPCAAVSGALSQALKCIYLLLYLNSSSCGHISLSGRAQSSQSPDELYSQSNSALSEQLFVLLSPQSLLFKVLPPFRAIIPYCSIPCQHSNLYPY